YLLAARHWGEEFVAQNLLGENLRHFVGGGFVSGERAWTFHFTHFRNIVTGTLPWGLFLPAAILAAWRLPTSARRERTLRLVRWLVAGLLFFSLAARKSPYYLLPLFPAVALLVAFWVSERAPRIALGAPGLIGRAPLGGAALLLVVLAASVAALRIGGIEVAELDAFLEALRRHPLVVPAGTAALLVVVAAAFLSLGRREWSSAVGRLWLGTFLTLSLAHRIEPVLDRELSMRRFAEAVRREAGDAPALYFFRKPARAVAFYAGRDIPTLAEGDPEPAPPFWLIVRGPFWEELPESWRARARIAAAGEGRVVTSTRMRIFLVEVGAGPRSGAGA
ncbi:MAG: hypothetical protein ACREQY_03435, partial [Candidatus Binatia bacterium]